MKLKGREHWIDQKDKIVTVNGLKCKLSISSYLAVYPIEEHIITIFADPINKNGVEYLMTKANLGDDWSFDVGNSVDLLCDVATQLNIPTFTN